ncbi:MAG TPA: AAA family ATPase [Candidatus Sulfotelmatobacter sp.]|nr:AAA family ATPase [Candidatus Sulfotelmatobacter sp.]
MKIRRIKINNFKSIIDTEFNIPKDLMALVGGNESGKSNVLSSLILFFSDSPLDQAYKHQLCIDDPKITIEFELSDQEKNTISLLIGNKKINTLIISKKGNVKTIENINLINKSASNTPETIKSIEPVQINDVAAMSKNDLNPQTTKNVLEANIESIEKTPEQINNEIFALLPKLVPVLSVDDLIGKKDILLSELIAAKSESTGILSTINSFLSLGEIDLDELSNPKLSFSIKNKMLLQSAAKAGKKIREYWTQEDLKIHFGINNETLSIHVRDGGCLPIKPLIKQNMKPLEVQDANKNIDGREDDTRWIWTDFDERSLGFRWFVTFYSKYLAAVPESENILIIIDDLGIYLNASIQEVLYKKLFNLTKKNVQIIYTTHSPYILDFTNTENILLVDKEENGTKVIEDWWKRKSFKELPKPLRDIGVSRADHIFKPKNLLVEGATDITVIRKLASLMGLNTNVKNNLESINIYPVGGKNEAIGVALYCTVDSKKAIILFDSEPDTLKLKQKALALNVAADDISSLAGTYDKTTFVIETIEDMIPDKYIVEALNVIGKKIVGNSWIDIGNLHRKSKNSVLGIIAALKERLNILVDQGVLSDENIEGILSSKKAILAEAIDNLKKDEYTNERRIAVENILNNLSNLIDKS